MTIKPIETVYNGYRFRSRLEARWAVFFDHLGIEYQYEPQGFDLGGVWYLPDFWIPSANAWIEIKSHLDHFSTDDHRKIEAFAQQIPLLVFLGPPGQQVHFGYSVIFHETADDGEPAFAWYPVFPGKLDNAFRFLIISPKTGECAHSPPVAPCSSRQFVHDAAEAARSARFEHGETPESPQ